MISTVLGIVLAIISGIVYYLKAKDRAETEKASEAADEATKEAQARTQVLEQERIKAEYDRREAERKIEVEDRTGWDDEHPGATHFYPKLHEDPDKDSDN